MIFALNVYCDHYQLGCKWKGQLKKLEVDKHLIVNTLPLLPLLPLRHHTHFRIGISLFQRHGSTVSLETKSSVRFYLLISQLSIDILEYSFFLVEI